MTTKMTERVEQRAIEPALRLALLLHGPQEVQKIWSEYTISEIFKQKRPTERVWSTARDALVKISSDLVLDVLAIRTSRARCVRRQASKLSAKQQKVEELRKVLGRVGDMITELTGEET